MESALGHDSFCSECWTAEVAPWDEKDMITLGHNYTTGWAIHVRSVPGSSVNFWSGVGLLKKEKDGYLPTVLSTNQYNEVVNKLERNKIDIFSKDYLNLNEILVLSS